MTQQTDTQAKKRATGFMAAFGIIADVSAVAALLFSNDFSLFVRIASVAGVVVGGYLLIQQWQKPVGMRVLVAVACITAGCVVGALSLAAETPLAVNGTSTDTKANNGGTAFQLRLIPYQGVDLDASKHEPVDTDGPNGDIDIFFEKFSYLELNNGSFYYPAAGPDSEVYTRCKNALTAEREPHPQVLPQKNVQVCFKTSGGKMGWLRVNDASLSGEVYTVLNVQLW